MEDFGYRKNSRKKPKKIKNKNYFIWLSLAISISLFAIISFKGYELIYENKEIETIHSPIFAIKILPEDEDALRLNNNNSNIVYEDIFGQNKEGLKGKHNIIFSSNVQNNIPNVSRNYLHYENKSAYFEKYLKYDKNSEGITDPSSNISLENKYLKYDENLNSRPSSNRDAMHLYLKYKNKYLKLKKQLNI